MGSTTTKQNDDSVFSFENISGTILVLRIKIYNQGKCFI